MPSLTVDIEVPRNRLLAEDYENDAYLLNQLDGINDHPE